MIQSTRLPTRRIFFALALVVSLVALVVGASYADTAEDQTDDYLISGHLIDAQDQPVEGIH